MWWWQTRNLLALALWPLSQVFGLVVALRRWAYASGWLASTRLPVPVVVIGNITSGGSGKTPLVIGLVGVLREAGYHPGIVSRGYGGQRHGGPRLVTAASDPRQVGDEPVLLAGRCRCPVVVDPDRPRGARELVRLGCDLVLTDDGLQHYALARDIEIAVVDGERRYGNGWLLPAGPLRERPARLQRVDFVVGNGRAATGEYPLRLRLERAVNLLDPACHRPLVSWSGQRVRAFAGIGHPARFFEALRAFGLEVEGRAFADHHRFHAAELDFGADDRPVLMTEKDAVKCRLWARPQHWYVPADTELAPTLAADLLARLASRFAIPEVSHGQETARYSGLSGQ